MKDVHIDVSMSGGDGGHLAVPVVVLPEVPVPALAGHVEGSEAHVPV